MARISSARGFTGGVLLTEPLGPYCGVTFFDEQSFRLDQLTLSETGPIDVLGMRATIGAGSGGPWDLYTHLVPIDPAAMKAETGFAVSVTTGGRSAKPGGLMAYGPECMESMMLAFGAAPAGAPFMLPECALLVE